MYSGNSSVITVTIIQNTLIHLQLFSSPAIRLKLAYSCRKQQKKVFFSTQKNSQECLYGSKNDNELRQNTVGMDSCRLYLPRALCTLDIQGHANVIIIIIKTDIFSIDDCHRPIFPYYLFSGTEMIVILYSKICWK